MLSSKLRALRQAVAAFKGAKVEPEDVEYEALWSVPTCPSCGEVSV